MKRFCVVLILASFSRLAAQSPNPFLGRWDLTVTTPSAKYPGWMEIVERDGKLEGRFQPRAGSVRPITSLAMEGSHMNVTLSGGSGQRPAVTWEVSASDHKLAGVQKRGDTVAAQ